MFSPKMVKGNFYSFFYSEATDMYLSVPRAWVDAGLNLKKEKEEDAPKPEYDKMIQQINNSGQVFGHNSFY